MMHGIIASRTEIVSATNAPEMIYWISGKQHPDYSSVNKIKTSLIKQVAWLALNYSYRIFAVAQKVERTKKGLKQLSLSPEFLLERETGFGIKVPTSNKNVLILTS